MRGRDSGQPWRAPSSSSRGGSQGGNNTWRNNSASRDAPISSAGLRRANGQVGRQLSEMEMLLSPSRGEGAGLASLTERATQERFRAHIDDKLAKLERDLPEGGDAAQEERRRAELSTILLDLRKLREGLTASHRVDGFTLKVYIDSIRYSLSSGNLPQLSACLPHLVFDILPELATDPTPPRPSPTHDPLVDSFAGMTIHQKLDDKLKMRVSPELVVLYQSLYLLYLICHLADLAAYHSALLAFTAPPPAALGPTATPDAWNDAEEAPIANADAASQPPHPHFAYTQRVFAALAGNNYAAFAKLVPPAASTQVLSSQAGTAPGLLVPVNGNPHTSSQASYAPTALHLAVARLAIPRLREQAWPALAKSYKVFTDYEWLGRTLLFPPGDEEGVKAFLRGKGFAVA